MTGFASHHSPSLLVTLGEKSKIFSVFLKSLYFSIARFVSGFHDETLNIFNTQVWHFHPSFPRQIQLVNYYSNCCFRKSFHYLLVAPSSVSLLWYISLMLSDYLVWSISLPTDHHVSRVNTCFAVYSCQQHDSFILRYFYPYLFSSHCPSLFSIFISRTGLNQCPSSHRNNLRLNASGEDRMHVQRVSLSQSVFVFHLSPRQFQ